MQKYYINHLPPTEATMLENQPLTQPNLVFRLDGRENTGVDCRNETVICEGKVLKDKERTAVDLNSLLNLGAKPKNRFHELGNNPIMAYPVKIPGINMTYIFVKKEVNGPQDVLGFTEAELDFQLLKQDIQHHNERLKLENIFNEKNIQTRLNNALKSLDAVVISSTLKDIAYIRYISLLANKTKMNKVDIYKILSGDEEPSFTAITRLTEALGYQIDLLLMQV